MTNHGRLAAVTLLKMCGVFELGIYACHCTSTMDMYQEPLPEDEDKQGDNRRSRRCTRAPNDTARQGVTTEGRRGAVVYLKKKMGTFRQVVVVSVRKSPTLVVCRAVLGFPAPSSLETLQAQHMRFQKRKRNHHAFWD